MDIGFLNRFEEKIQGELLRICTSHGMLDGVLLATDDITGHWDTLAPEYVADAVGQIADYPTVSVAWAGYLGLAVAHGWDKNWQECLKQKESILRQLWQKTKYRMPQEPAVDMV